MKNLIKVVVNNIPIIFEVDTGSPIILIDNATYMQYFQAIPLTSYKRKLYTANGQQLQILGSFVSHIAAGNKNGSAEIVVGAHRSKYALLGETGLDVLFNGWRTYFTINNVSNDKDLRLSILSEIKCRFSRVTDGDLTKPIEKFEVDLHLIPDAVPIHAKARQIPFGLYKIAQGLLNDLVSQKVIRHVEDSVWASPIVLVGKPNGSYRMCIDPSRTLNPSLCEDHYQLNTVDNFLVEVGGHLFYTMIDLTGAFQQVKLTNRSAKLVTITTPFGLYEFLRLPFGVKTASAIFQRVIDQILKRFPWAKAYIDDIVIYADSIEQMHQRVMWVFEALNEFNVKANMDKTVLCATNLKILGHVVSQKGISPTTDRIQEIVCAETPKNVKELQSFLGIMNYVRKFIPSLSTVLSPLNRLLKKEVAFRWGSAENQAFENAKKMVNESKFLMHFDSRKQIYICTDASDVGIGAVLCHMCGNDLQPVFFKSRTLQPAETRYPILHRELLAVVYACEEYYKFIFGTKTIVLTDHQPLVPIIRNGNTLATVSTRIQRYLLRLSPYDLNVIYKSGKLNVLADFPSRFPRRGIKPSKQDSEEESLAMTINSVTDGQKLNLGLIRKATAEDTVMKELAKAITNGNFSKVKQFSSVASKLNLSQDNLITCDGRIVVPESLQDTVVDLLHDGHLGVVKMKQLARKYFYWPGLNKVLEKKAKECQRCKVLNPDRTSKVFIPWPKPTRPFDRIHIDFFYLEQKQFLLLIDAYSRWVEALPMKNTTASHVVTALRRVFSNFGDPNTIVCDNGPPFGSAEFNKFCDESQIRLMHSPPYHPQSNGVAERWVQTVKIALKKEFEDEGGFSEHGLLNVLFRLRNTPSVDGNIPSDMIFNFQPRTALVKAVSEPNTSVGTNTNIPSHRVFEIGQWVIYKSQEGGVKAEVIARHGQTVYEIRVGGKNQIAHANQLRPFIEKIDKPTPMVNVQEQTTTVRRSTRTRRQPDKLNL